MLLFFHSVEPSSSSQGPRGSFILQIKPSNVVFLHNLFNAMMQTCSVLSVGVVVYSLSELHSLCLNSQFPDDVLKPNKQLK